MPCHASAIPTTVYDKKILGNSYKKSMFSLSANSIPSTDWTLTSSMMFDVCFLKLEEKVLPCFLERDHSFRRIFRVYDASVRFSVENCGIFVESINLYKLYDHLEQSRHACNFASKRTRIYESKEKNFLEIDRSLLYCTHCIVLYCTHLLISVEINVRTDKTQRTFFWRVLWKYRKLKDYCASLFDFGDNSFVYNIAKRSVR